MDASIHYRKISQTDMPLLREIYLQNRLPELEPLTWSDEQKDLFLQSQFLLQHRQYQERFPQARFLLILLLHGTGACGIEAGRLYVDEAANEMRIIDISLLPPFRNNGIGTRILCDCIAQARRRHKTVVLHVEKHNRAQNLYRRLGFRTTVDNGVYQRMELDLRAQATSNMSPNDGIHHMTGATSHG